MTITSALCIAITTFTLGYSLGLPAHRPKLANPWIWVLLVCLAVNLHVAFR